MVTHTCSCGKYGVCGGDSSICNYWELNKFIKAYEKNANNAQKIKIHAQLANSVIRLQICAKWNVLTQLNVYTLKHQDVINVYDYIIKRWGW